MINFNHIKIARKGSHKFFFTLLDEDGDPIDLTAATINMSAKIKHKDATTQFDKAGSIIVAANGTFSVTLTPNETTLNVGKYYYDVVVTSGTDRYTVERGVLQIFDNITL